MKSIIIAIVSSVIGCSLFIVPFLLNNLYDIQCIDENHFWEKESFDDDFKISDWLCKFLIVTFFYFNHQLLQKYLNLFTKLLRVQKDLDDFRNVEPQLALQTELKSLTDNSTETMTTTIANGTKVISARVKIKKQQRAMKRHSVRKIAKAHKANKRKSSIRKIHISIEKSIHVITTTNRSQQYTADLESVNRQEKFDVHENGAGNEEVLQNSIKDEFQSEKRQLKKLFLIFGVRMLKEIFMM